MDDVGLSCSHIFDYRGSPIGTCDMERRRARQLLEQHDIVLQPGINEDRARFTEPGGIAVE